MRSSCVIQFIGERKLISFSEYFSGIIIGNGLTDPLHQIPYGDYVYQLGLIDANALDEIHQMEEEYVNLVLEENYSGADLVIHFLSCINAIVKPTKTNLLL